ncbi:MAG: MFS transporter [Actinocatenispora sp.]
MTTTPEAATAPDTGPIDAPPTGPTGHRWRWFGLGVVLCAEVMDLVDSTVTTVAAPTIRSALGGGTPMLQWLTAAYTLAFALGLITGARLGDMYGRRRLFLIGAAGFTAASMACGLAVTPGMMITGRAVQGAFGALLIPQGFGLVKDMFPAKEINRAFGLYGPVLGLSAIGGPILAGALIGADLFGAGWRLIFLINLPVGLLALAGAVAFLPTVRSATTQRLDLVGVPLVGAGLVALIYPLVQGRELGWPAWTFALLVVGGALLAAFAVHQRRRHRAGRATLITPSVFAKRSYTGGLILGAVFFTSVMGFLLVYALYIQLGLGYSPLTAGLTQTPSAVGIVLGSILGTKLVARLGRRVLQCGMVMVALGTGGLAATVAIAGPLVAPWQFGPAMFLTGAGMGMVFSPLFTFILAGVDGDEVGSASGLLNAVQQVANATGAAVIGSLFFAFVGSRGGPSGYGAAFELVLPIVLVTVVASFLLVYLLPARADDQ